MNQCMRSADVGAGFPSQIVDRNGANVSVALAGACLSIGFRGMALSSTRPTQARSAGHLTCFCGRQSGLAPRRVVYARRAWKTGSRWRHCIECSRLGLGHPASKD